MTMKQLALDIGLATGPTLERFFAGPNEAALQHLRLAAGAGSSETTRSPVPTYLWGEPGSGKTHLLQAVRQALREQGSSVGWLDPTVGEPPDFDERWAAVVMDDVHLYDTAQQATAFNWFVNAISPASGSQRWVLAAGDLPPADLPLRDDLRSRLGWGHVFQLHLLIKHPTCIKKLFQWQPTFHSPRACRAGFCIALESTADYGSSHSACQRSL